MSIKGYETCFDSAGLISGGKYRHLVISSMSGEQKKHSFAFSVLSIDYHISDYIRHCVNHTSHLITATRVAGLGRLSAGAKMAMKPFVKRVFTIFATNASFLRVISNFRI